MRSPAGFGAGETKVAASSVAAAVRKEGVHVGSVAGQGVAMGLWARTAEKYALQGGGSAVWKPRCER